MYGRKSINGRVECIGVPIFQRNDGTPRAENILYPSPRWGVEDTDEIWALEIQPGSSYIGVDVPWRGAVPARAEHLPQNVRNCAPVCDNLLWDHSLARAQSLSDSRHILRDKLINRTDFDLDDIWDKPAPQ